VQINGIKPSIVDVEVDTSRGMHAFTIVGLADKAIEEAKDRLAAAIKNSGFKPITKGSKKIVVSLAPADVKKEGSHYDLAIALAFLLAEGEIRINPKKRIFWGELPLDGKLRPGRGALMLAQTAKNCGYEEVYLPADNAREAALIRGIRIFPCRDLREIVDHLSPAVKPAPGTEPEPSFEIEVQPETEIAAGDLDFPFDFSDVRGQESAKRGLEIAAAGGHNAAMSGPPGTGKSMLAKAFCGILPPLSYDEIIEATGLHSVAGILDGDLVAHPPFRSPHHTSSYISIVGGGAWPKPGEITLAHRGVLFLDELPEFEKRVVESLRQPLEDKVISISRSKGTMLFPANFMLIATMNPCPCGYNGSSRPCTCSAADIARYQKKLSGPIMDRIDLWLDVPQIDHEKLSAKGGGEGSAEIRDRVIRARQIQLSRFANEKKKIKTNAEMSIREIVRYAPLDEKLSQILNTAAKRLDLSARAYHRIVKLARTIADLDSAPDIAESHLAEALNYRPRIGA
jgi:magnesium chelatase family protein